jgi:hypothetical protein
MKNMAVAVVVWMLAVSAFAGKDKMTFMTASDEFRWEADFGCGLYQDFNTYRGRVSDLGPYVQVPVVHYKHVSIGFGFMVPVDNPDRSRPMFSLMFGNEVKDGWFNPKIGVSVLVSPYEAMAVCLDLISIRF